MWTRRDFLHNIKKEQKNNIEFKIIIESVIATIQKEKKLNEMKLYQRSYIL